MIPEQNWQMLFAGPSQFQWLNAIENDGSF
jgi:hypothetical protein